MAQSDVPPSPIDLLTGLRRLVADPNRIDVSEAGLLAHSYDWWPLASKWRFLKKTATSPGAVVYPETTEEVAAVLLWADANGVAVTAWGLGSSVVGQPLSRAGGITLDLSRMTRLISVDEENLVVRAEAGLNGGALEGVLNAKGYTLNHSPQSLHRSTIGGWLATRATGQYSSRYGGIEDLVFAFKAVLANGDVVETAITPRMAVGPDLRHMLIGSEGTMGVITEVALKIFPRAEHRIFQTLTFPDVASGVAGMRAVMAAGLRPFLLRLYDTAEARHAMRDSAFATPVMFLGTEGIAAVAEAEMAAALDLLGGLGGQPIGEAGVRDWHDNRRYDFSSIEKVLARPEGVAETIEVSNTWSGIMDTYDALTKALAPFATEVLGHFSHSYTTGTSLYVILVGEAESLEQAEARIEDIWKTANETALATGASVSHHHGAGLARGPYVRRNLGSSMALLERLKTAMDPNDTLNPGKLGLTEQREDRGR